MIACRRWPLNSFVDRSQSLPRAALRRRWQRRRRPKPFRSFLKRLPIQSKLASVQPAARRRGNAPGLTHASKETAPKWLNLLHELLPRAGVLALPVNPTPPVLPEPQKREVLSAAQALGIDLHVLNASTEQD